MKTLGNVLWFTLGFGWLAGTIWVLAGALCYVTIVLIPFGTACFRIASFAYFPFGKELVDARDVGEGRIAMTGLGNFLWVVLVGLWSSISFILAGIGMLCGIVTIPFAFAYFKLAAAGFAPLGKRIVSSDMARVIREGKAREDLNRRTGRGGDGGTGDGSSGRLAPPDSSPRRTAFSAIGFAGTPEPPEEPEETEEDEEPEEDAELEEGDNDTGGDIFLKKVRLGRKLDAAMEEDLSAVERRRLENIRDLYLAGMEAQQSGEKESAGVLYQRAEKALAEWRKTRRARRAPSPTSPMPPRGNGVEEKVPEWLPMAGIAVVVVALVAFLLWKQDTGRVQQIRQETDLQKRREAAEESTNLFLSGAQRRAQADDERKAAEKMAAKKMVKVEEAMDEPPAPPAVLKRDFSRGRLAVVEVEPIADVTADRKGEKVKIAGAVVWVGEKKGNQPRSVVVKDEAGDTIYVKYFDDVAADMAEAPAKGDSVTVEGVVDAWNGKASILLQDGSKWLKVRKGCARAPVEM